MVLECVSAAGEVVPPSFCLQNGSAPDLHAMCDDQWGRYDHLEFALDPPNLTKF